MRPSRRSATSSTRACRASKASCSALAWATRSVCPWGPSTTRWAARTRRIRRVSTSSQASAISAPAAAARATTPGASSNADTLQKLTAHEERRVRRLVVVGLLLAGNGVHDDRDVDRGVQRRRLVERERDRDLLALGRARDGLVEGQRRAAGGLRDRQRDLDVELVVVALVGEGDGEGLAGDIGQPVRDGGLEGRVAVGGGVKAGPVQTGAGGLV